MFDRQHEKPVIMRIAQRQTNNLAGIESTTFPDANADGPPKTTSATCAAAATDRSVHFLQYHALWQNPPKGNSDITSAIVYFIAKDTMSVSMVKNVRFKWLN